MAAVIFFFNDDKIYQYLTNVDENSMDTFYIDHILEGPRRQKFNDTTDTDIMSPSGVLHIYIKNQPLLLLKPMLLLQQQYLKYSIQWEPIQM